MFVGFDDRIGLGWYLVVMLGWFHLSIGVFELSMAGEGSRGAVDFGADMAGMFGLNLVLFPPESFFHPFLLPRLH